MRPETDVDVEGLLARIDRLEQRAEKAEAELSRLTKRTGELENRPAAAVAARPAAAPVNQAEEPITTEEQVETIRSTFPEAKAEEILALAEDWNRKILPQITNPMRTYLQGLSVIPDTEEGAEGARLQLVFSGTMVGSNADAYFAEPENMAALEERVSALAERSVHFRVAHRDRMSRQESVLDMTKIHFDAIEEK